MYFVDRRNIEELLSHMEWCMETFAGHQEWSQPVDRFALERLAHVLIETILDVGNQMIDGFIMRDPGGYADIIDILCDEKVLAQEDGSTLKDLIEQRKPLVRSYTAIDHNKLRDLLTASLPALQRFPESIRRYLDEELGPVSAFLPEDEQGPSE